MILDNLTRALKTQNWLAAGIEFLIVVSGVVIGFQINAWNEGRQDQARAALYLERLSADLEENLRRNTNDVAFRTSVRELGIDALDYAAGRAEPDSDWAVITAFFNASQAGSSLLVTSTYDEILSVGDQRLVGDAALRNELTAYFTAAPVDNILGTLPAYRESVRMLIPIRIQDYILTQCYRANADGDGQRVIDCEPPSDLEYDYAALADQLTGNEPLLGELRFWVSTQSVALSIYEARRLGTLRALDSVNAARSRP